MPSFPLLTLPRLRFISIDFLSCEPGRPFIECARYSRIPRSRSGPACASAFFVTLVLPMLRQLRLTCDGLSTDDALMPILEDLKKRSGCTLRMFEMINIAVEMRALYGFLLKVPELERLRLQCNRGRTPQGYWQILEAMHFKPDCDNNPLPNLEELAILDIDGCPDDEFLDDVALSMLESRWWWKEPCPHKQQDLLMLIDVMIYWYTDGASEYPEEPQPEALARAQKLRDRKMLLYYPSLGLNLQPKSNFN